MCYTGMCPHENERGDCMLPSNTLMKDWPKDCLLNSPLDGVDNAEKEHQESAQMAREWSGNMDQRE